MNKKEASVQHRLVLHEYGAFSPRSRVHLLHILYGKIPKRKQIECMSFRPNSLTESLLIVCQYDQNTE